MLIAPLKLPDEEYVDDCWFSVRFFDARSGGVRAPQHQSLSTRPQCLLESLEVVIPPLE